MTIIENWSDGRLITLNPGDTAICNGGLNAQQLYGIFFYNVAQNDTGATLNVVWSNSQPPQRVQVPGTTMKQGLASVLFVSGSDTSTVSVAMLQNQPGAQIQCFICSVKMPVNTTGINNMQLPADGQPHAFQAFTRYYTVPASHWYAGQITSNVNQFISVQFTQQSAQVYVVNSTTDPSPLVQAVGTAKTQYKLQVSSTQSLDFNMQGNGTQMVWMNADSIQNSQGATIALQSLSGLYEYHR